MPGIFSKKSVVLLLIALAAFFVFNKRSDPIREIVTSIQKQLTFEGQLHPIALATFAKDLTEYVFDPLNVHVEYQGAEHSHEIKQKDLVMHLAAGRREITQLATTISGIEIVRDGPDKARATLELKAMGKTGERSDYFLEIFDVTADFINDKERGWVINSVEARDKRSE